MGKLFSKSNVVYATLVLVTIAIVLFSAAGIIISGQVNQNCTKAMKLYTGDCVDALSQKLMDETQSYRDRNSAIWTLGQIGDPKALPVLEKYYTGIIPDREPLGGAISQHELKKAIKLTNGGNNITHIFR